jgi:hypothetical protein
MSKLTPLHKEANKAAYKIRDRAFAERKRAYRKAINEAEQRVEQSDVKRAVDAAQEAFDRAIEEHDAAADSLRRQILALQEQLAQIKSANNLNLEIPKSVRMDAWQKWRDAKDAAIDEVNARFPDLPLLTYVGAWAIPPDVQAEMEAARVRVLALPA